MRVFKKNPNLSVVDYLFLVPKQENHLRKQDFNAKNGIEPHFPTGPIIAQRGKKKKVAKSHDVSTTNDKENRYKDKSIEKIEFVTY